MPSGHPPQVISNRPYDFLYAPVKRKNFQKKFFFWHFLITLSPCPQGIFIHYYYDFPYAQLNGEKRKNFYKKFFLALSYHPLPCPQGIHRRACLIIPYDFPYASVKRKKFYKKKFFGIFIILSYALRTLPTIPL
jgi:hypothetical protein